jgi:hypothetical protein
MKNFVILIIQLCGYAFILVSILSVVNMLTGWNIGYQGAEVPGDPAFAIVFFVMGLVVTPVGMFLDKRTGK